MKLVQWLQDLSWGIFAAAGAGACSFCARPCDQTVVRKPGVKVCNDCVDICIRILEDRLTAAGLADI
jgi:hypothetical protein